MAWSFYQLLHSRDADLDSEIVHHPLGQRRGRSHDGLLRFDGHLVSRREAEASRAGE